MYPYQLEANEETARPMLRSGVGVTSPNMNRPTSVCSRFFSCPVILVARGLLTVEHRNIV